MTAMFTAANTAIRALSRNGRQSRVPASHRYTELEDTCKRRATSTCDHPARLRIAGSPGSPTVSILKTVRFESFSYADEVTIYHIGLEGQEVGSTGKV